MSRENLLPKVSESTESHTCTPHSEPRHPFCPCRRTLHPPSAARQSHVAWVPWAVASTYPPSAPWSTGLPGRDPIRRVCRRNGAQITWARSKEPQTLPQRFIGGKLQSLNSAPSRNNSLYPLPSVGGDREQHF